MFLAIDIGNSNITFGVFEQDKLVYTTRLISDKNKSLEDYSNSIKLSFADYEIGSCMIASVADELTQVIKSSVDSVFNIDSKIMTSSLKYGMGFKADTPEKIGTDRIANAAAAKKYYSYPALVVDIGTATTIDVLDAEGDFSGGIIMSGINIQLKALSQNTSKLPLIEPQTVDRVIGKNTVQAMLSGVIRGHACAIEGLLKLCTEELGSKPTVIATGGQAELISKYLKFDSVNPDLTLLGTKIIYDINFKDTF